MKKFLAVVFANVLVFSLVVAMSVGVFALAAADPSSNPGASNGGGIPEPVEPFSGPYDELAYVLTQAEDEEGKVIYSAEAHKAVSYEEEDALVYDIGGWLLDQIDTKLDTTDGDIKNAVFTLGEAASAEKLIVKLDGESKFLFPGENKGLVLVIPGCGKITVPAQSSDVSISDITIAFDGDNVNFDALSGDTSMTALEVLFEAEEGTAYTLVLPEVEAEEEAAEAELVEEVVEETAEEVTEG